MPREVTMTALVVILVVLVLWAWWVTRPRPGLAPMPTQRTGPAAPEASGLRVLPPVPAIPTVPPRPPAWRLPGGLRPSARDGADSWPLTEDDLIAFGLELEAADDVVAELVGRV
jgi:hypothetical protein